MSPRSNARSPAAASGRAARAASARDCSVGGPSSVQRAMRLLEVVADELLVVAGEVPRPALDPLGELLVHRRPDHLRDAVVGGVPDEDVGEAVRVLLPHLGAVGLDQVLADERLQARRDARPGRGRRERRHRAPPERPADDRPALDHGALRRLEPVQAGGDQCVDRRRDRDPRQVAADAPAAVLRLQHAVVDEHPEDLLDEQRVALADGGDPGARLARQLGVADEAADQGVALGRVERAERDQGRVVLGGQPGGADLEQLGARLADA